MDNYEFNHNRIYKHVHKNILYLFTSWGLSKVKAYFLFEATIDDNELNC